MAFSLALRLLHVAAAALWMGSALYWPGALRRALAAGPPHAAPALALARTALGLDLGAGVATMLTGLVYASPVGGGRLRAGILVGLALALVRLGLLLGLARPAVRRVSEADAAKDAVAALAAARPIPAYAGSAHLLWLLALVFMVFPI
jgi:hypothetical protein